MFCPHCGKEIPEEAEFCSYCGKSLTFSEKRRTKLAPVFIVAIVGIGALAVIIVMAHHNKSDVPKSSDSPSIVQENKSSADSLFGISKKDTYYSADKLPEYLGIGYSPDTPFTYFWGNERIITDNKGNIMVREDSGYEHKETFPKSSDFHGNCRIGRKDDHSLLINKAGEVLYTNPAEKYYMYSHEMSNGRVLFECNSEHNCWLIDENGNEITKPSDNVLSCGSEYYTVRTEDMHTVLYDYDDNVIFEGSGKVRFGLTSWEGTNDRYLWVNDGTNYSDGGEGDVTIYQFPDMKVVFTAQKVLNQNEFGTGVVFAFVPDILSNNARLVVIYRGKVTIDTNIEFDQRISARGKYYQDRVIIDHDSYDWVYTTYELRSGKFISENLQRSAAGEYDDELYDRTTTAMEKNEICAERLGIDMTTYTHGVDFSYQMPIRAELFEYLEKETNRRVFCNYMGNGLVELVDDVSGETIICGTEMYAPIPDEEKNSNMIFAYASNGDGGGQLVNLATGKKLNIEGELVGFQKIYAVFKENDGSHIVYNFDLDSFNIDINGNPTVGDLFEKLKKNEPKYVAQGNNTTSDEKVDDSGAVERLKQYAVKELENMGDEYAEETVEDYLSYQLVRSADLGKGEYAYFGYLYIERTLTETVLLTPDGKAHNFEKDKSAFEKYRNYFSFDITDYSEHSKIVEDPTLIEGGDEFEQY